MPCYIGVLHIKPLISFFELFLIGMHKGVFFWINEACFKKELPKGV